MTKSGAQGVAEPDPESADPGPEPIEKAAPRALAKTLSFNRVGKHAEATAWANTLVGLLRVAGILVTT